MPKPKEKVPTVKCPVCQKRVGKKEIQKMAGLLPFEGFFYQGNDMLASFMEVVSRYGGFYQWACDDCLEAGRALLAQPAKQNHTHKHPADTVMPYLAYVDQSYSCRNCGLGFVFSKEEQQHWYETLAIYVEARPVYCKACRTEIRTARALNTELSDLLKEGTPKEKEKLLRIAAIYQEMNKPDKQKHYLSLAKKA